MPRLLIACAIAVLLFAPAAFSQLTITGNIGGTVMDPSGQVIPGAKITLTNPSNGDSRATMSSEAGGFTLIAVQPGTYSLKIEHAGFKTFQRTGIVLSANEHLAAGDIQLQIGQVSETISVEA